MFKLNFRQIFRLRSAHSCIKVNHLVNSQYGLIIPRQVHVTNFLTTKEQRLPDEASSSEKEFLVRMKNDADTFGEAVVDKVVDLDDEKEEEYLQNVTGGSKKLSTKQYADLIKGFIRKRKIKEAIDVVEVKMLKQDRVKPENYLYNLLLGACGRVGYTKKAFSLYNDMKRRGLKVTHGTYTALFNACANSPWPTTDGLTRAKHLHKIMIEKRHEPNDTNYNALIKAYGRGGDLMSAFAVVDEMIAKQFPIKDDTLNFLLQACISDKDAGFRHALLVWRKFVDKDIAPSIFTYNLILRSIRDCGLGDLEVTTDIFTQILPETDTFLQIPAGSIERSIEEDLNIIDSFGKVTISDFGAKRNELQEIEKMSRPNLMAKIPHMGNIISLNEVKKASDRLLLVGGAAAYIDNMIEHNCKPDIKTFTQLIDCIPSTRIAENEILLAMKKLELNPDLDFYNMLIKKRSMRADYDAGKEVLAMIRKAHCTPNIITYGVLALGCKTKEEAIEFLTFINEAGFRLNIEILGAMLKQACYHYNFSYVMEIMDICVKEEITPNQMFMKHLEDFKKKCKYGKNEDVAVKRSTSFEKHFQVFKMRYKTFKNEVKPEEDVHPWEQFRRNTDTIVSHYKDKSARFKPRHKSLFRQKQTPTTVVSKPNRIRFNKFKPKQIDQ